MSIEVTMVARCDGCRKVLDAAMVPQSRIQPTRWRWEKRWSNAGVLQITQTRRTTKHYCQPCADGNNTKNNQDEHRA